MRCLHRYNQDLKRRLQGAVGRWRAGLLAGAFSLWQQQAVYERQLNSGMAAVVVRMRNGTLASAFDGWR
jgi:hypothetical protein